MTTTFEQLPVGDGFNCNETWYVKVSSRTALLLSNGKRFYFDAQERVAPRKGNKIATIYRMTGELNGQ